MQDKRVSVFSFSQNTLLANVIFFILLVVSYAIMVAKHEIAKGRDSFVETIIVTVGHVSSFVPIALILTFIVIEVGGFVIMYLWNLYQRKQQERLEERIEEVRAEGRAEAKAEAAAVYGEWLAWNNRRMEAEAQGLPFNEPPPANPHAADK